MIQKSIPAILNQLRACLIRIMYLPGIRSGFLGLALLLWVVQPAVAMPGDGHWDRQFAMPGTASWNSALRFNGNRLYTGGLNMDTGQVATNPVVSIFDGTNWSSLGGITGGLALIYDFAFLGNDLYMGGVFTGAGGIPAVGLAKWNGTDWSGVGGFSGVVLGMATDGTNLYVGGSFTNCGGVFATNVAKWNGTNWSALGDGIGYYDSVFYPIVNVLVWHNGQLYAGGSFTNIGSTTVSNLARWDGSSWTQVGGGVGGSSGYVSGGEVMALQFMGNDLFVGGQFSTAGTVSALNVAKWNGSAWSALGTGLKGPSGSTAVNALAVLGSELYATGTFTNAGGLTARVARWDGASWHSLGAINGNGVRAATNSGSVYICGDFNVANYNTSSNVIGNHILRWDGAGWHGVAGKSCQGTHIFVQSLGLGSDGLYVGGLFNVIGTTTASRIARWDGTNWSAPGGGVKDAYGGSTLTVRAIKARDYKVYVGGGFTTAGGLTANNVAAWDGSSWSTLGYGVDYPVFAIDTTATDVYVGGSFTNAKNSPVAGYTVNRIARWNATSGWLPLGSGMNGTVNAICAQGGVVYAGGSFTTAGGNTANRIAMWDGANWSSLGSGTANGLGGTVNAILVDGTDVYVGGSFTTAGGAAAYAIARWNGSSWSSLGSGMSSTGTATVSALAKMGGYLYASGTFTNAGSSVVTRNIARWDGAKWEALGSGVGNDFTPGASRVSALAVWGSDLFLGGTFETAGGCDAGYVARWNDQIDFTPPSVMRLSNLQMLSGYAFRFRVTATERAAYVVEYSLDLANWTPLTTNSAASLDITNSVPGVQVRNYRMREIP